MKEQPRYVKEYVEVLVEFAPDGTMLPRILVWEDGRRYEIDKIKAIQPAPTLKAASEDKYAAPLIYFEPEIFIILPKVPLFEFIGRIGSFGNL